MQFTKSVMALALAAALSACSSQSILKQAEQDYQQYEQITRQFQVNAEWWKGYNDKQLDGLVEKALANNANLAKAAIAVNRAYYNANLVGANLVPTFSASGSSSATKGVGSNNIHSTSVSTIGHQAGFNLSYTLDLWGRLTDSASAAEWEHKATQEDLQATRLSIINGVVSSYYNLAYYHDAVRVTEENIKAYEQMYQIMHNKFNAGLIDRVAADQSMQAVLAAKNTLVSLKTAQKMAEQTLRNLLNIKPDEQLVAAYPSILDVKLQGIDLDVPVSAIANRPDVIAALQRFQSAFKSVRAMEKSWFPTITLGGSLSGSAGKASEVGDNPVMGGVVSFNLPFLDWYRVNTNIKLSEEGYKLAKVNYEQAVTSALNEIDTYYYAYQQSLSGYANVEKKYDYDKKISSYYQNRYNQGVAELREWLTAINTERSSQLSLLETKYTILKNENAVYQAMAGKYRR